MTSTEFQTMLRARMQKALTDQQRKMQEALQKQRTAYEKKRAEILKKLKQQEAETAKRLAMQRRLAAQRANQAQMQQALAQRQVAQRQERRIYEPKCAITTDLKEVTIKTPIKIKWSASPGITIKNIDIKYSIGNGTKTLSEVPKEDSVILRPTKPGKYKASIFVSGYVGKSCKDSVEFTVNPEKTKNATTTNQTIHTNNQSQEADTEQNYSWFSSNKQTSSTSALPPLAKISLVPNPVYVGGQSRINWQGNGKCILSGYGLNSLEMEGTGNVSTAITPVFTKPGIYIYTLSCVGARADAKLVVLNKAALSQAPKAQAPKINEYPNITSNTTITNPPTHMQCPVFKQYLKVGSKGAEVKKIEAFLAEQTCFAGTPDLVFDLETEQAVRCFQAKYVDQILKYWKLSTPTGYWYKTTRSYANRLEGCKDPTFNPQW